MHYFLSKEYLLLTIYIENGFFQIKAGKTYNEFELAEKIDGLRAKMEKFVDLRLGFLEFSLKNQVHEVKRN